jgi:hypothetical protein
VHKARNQSLHTSIYLYVCNNRQYITVNFVYLHDIYNVEQIIIWLRHLIDIFPKESQLYTGEIRNIKLINTVDFTDALLHNFNKYYELYTS